MPFSTFSKTMKSFFIIAICRSPDSAAVLGRSLLSAQWRSWEYRDAWRGHPIIIKAGHNNAKWIKKCYNYRWELLHGHGRIRVYVRVPHALHGGVERVVVLALVLELPARGGGE